MSWIRSRDGKVLVNLAQVSSLELELSTKGYYTLRAFGSTSPHEGLILAGGLTEEAGEGLLKIVMLLPAGENLDLGDLKGVK